MRKKLTFVLFSYAVYLFLHGNSDIKLIKEPEPKYHGIGNAKTLKLIKSIEEIADENLSVFADIGSAAADRDNNFYIFDHKHGTIVKLNSRLEYVRSIGRKGEGPGEFKIWLKTLNYVSVGQDNKLYFSNLMQRKVMKFSLSGKYIDEYRVDNFKPFKAVVDGKGNFLLPSLKEYIIDVYDPNMNFKNSLVSKEFRQTYLYYEPKPCVIHRHSVNNYLNMMYGLLSTGDLILLNNIDLSVIIVDLDSGKIKRQFYAWDDYLLSEYKAKLYSAKKRSETQRSTCAYCLALTDFFVDDQDNIYIFFLDSKLNKFLYKFSTQGDLNQVYKVESSDIEGAPHFFHFKDNKYYAHSNYGIHIFKEKDEKIEKPE